MTRRFCRIVCELAVVVGMFALLFVFLALAPELNQALGETALWH